MQNGRIVLANPAAEGMSGYSVKELLGMENPIQILIHPDDLPDILERVVQRAKGEVVPSLAIYRIVHRSGKTRWVESYTKQIEFGGEPADNTVYIDITERKQAEEALRESEERFSTLAEAAFEGIVISDKGYVADCNEQLAAMLGYEQSEMIGFEVRKFVAPESLEIVLEHIKSGSEEPYEHLSLRKDGTRFPVEVRAKSIPYKGQQVRVTAIRDITERKRAEEKLAQQLEYLRALHKIDQAITTNLDLKNTLDLFVEEVAAQLHVDAVSVLILDQDQRLNFAAGNGFIRTNTLKYTRLPLGQGLAGRAAAKREVVHIDDLRGLTENPALSMAIANEEFVAYYGVPLIAKDQLRGVLEVFHRSHLAPDDDWLDFLETLAGQAAISIDYATLFDDLQQSNRELQLAYDATLKGWSRALDLRDKETEGHTQRVTEMTVRLARMLGFSEDELIHIQRGALLHDIGKMGVPDSILFKPGPLTDEEWAIMRKHPEYAYEMLLPIQYLHPALAIPHYHHERWDGSGYPRGLRGEEIPLAARIFAVVDVWDALNSDRPYRKAWSKEAMLAYIQEQAGTHFDPQVVQAFLEENY